MLRRHGVSILKNKFLQLLSSRQDSLDDPNKLQYKTIGNQASRTNTPVNYWHKNQAIIFQQHNIYHLKYPDYMNIELKSWEYLDSK